jgi:endonuclease YncB( thermonuclease family)
LATWTVPFLVERVVDGDTLAGILDLGWGVYKRDHVRLARVDAPEIRTEEGKRSREALAAFLAPLPATLKLTSTRLDKYGRALGELVTGEGVNVSDWLLEHGLAARYGGER